MSSCALVRRGIVATAVTFAMAGLPTLTSAVCALLSPRVSAEIVAESPVVFVGRVNSVSDGGYVASFEVAEIWRGPNLSNPVTVSGGESRFEDSRTWEVGQQYLVIPSVTESGDLVATGCSRTSVYEPEFDTLRPASAHPPQGPPTSGLPGATPIAAIFLAILVLGSLGAFLLYHRGGGEPSS
jgi:hypothetical protein